MTTQECSWLGYTLRTFLRPPMSEVTHVGPPVQEDVGESMGGFPGQGFPASPCI